MKAYFALISAQFRMLLQYRAAALAGFSTQLFWGLIRVMIFEAFFFGSKVRQPMDIATVVTYIWLSQAFFAMLPFRPNAEIAAMVRDGTIAFEMLRPLNIYNLWFCRSVAERTAPTVLRAVPMFIVAGLFFNLQAPAGIPSFLFFLLALFLALMLACAISALVSISMLWTISGQGIPPISTALVFAFSGMIVPIPFYPDILRGPVKLLPFRGIIDTPMRIYIGHLTGGEMMLSLLHQAVWICLLVVVGRWLLSRGFKRLVVQGG